MAEWDVVSSARRRLCAEKLTSDELTRRSDLPLSELNLGARAAEHHATFRHGPFSLMASWPHLEPRLAEELVI